MGLKLGIPVLELARILPETFLALLAGECLAQKKIGNKPGLSQNIRPSEILYTTAKGAGLGLGEDGEPRRGGGVTTISNDCNNS